MYWKPEFGEEVANLSDAITAQITQKQLDDVEAEFKRKARRFSAEARKYLRGLLKQQRDLVTEIDSRRSKDDLFQATMAALYAIKVETIADPLTCPNCGAKVEERYTVFDVNCDIVGIYGRCLDCARVCYADGEQVSKAEHRP